MSDITLWSLIGLPSVVGALLCLIPRPGGEQRFAAPLAILAAVATLGLAVATALDRGEVAVPFLAGTVFALRVDGLSAAVVVLIAAVTVLVLVFAAGEIAEARARFYGLMLIFAAAALLTATAATLPVLLMAWEVMGATSYALIAFWWREPARVSSGLTAFLVTRVADLGLYAAAGAALAGGAGLALSALPNAAGGWRDAIALGVLVSALGKAAQLPFSFWISRAMDGPSPVSALLHSAALVAMGGYLLLRVEPLLAATSWAGPVTAWIGGATALILGAIALTQTDLKQLLAASTSAQMGFVVLAAGVGSVAGGTAHLIAHAATKALLFLIAGAWLSALGTKRLSALRGVARRGPALGIAVTLGALALAGVPPLSLWATKDAVLASALQQSLALYLLGLAAAAMSAAYAGKILVTVWSPIPPESGVVDEEQPGTRHIGPLEKLPILVLAVFATVLGAVALGPLGAPFAKLVAGSAAPEPTVVELISSGVIAIAVVAVVFRVRIPTPSTLRGWLGMEQLAHALTVRPTLALARSLAAFDDAVLDAGVLAVARSIRRVSARLARFDDAGLDRGVTALAALTPTLARGSARVDTAVIDGAVESLASGVRRLGALARRPQTGQLHHYYIQAIGVLAAACLVVVLVR